MFKNAHRFGKLFKLVLKRLTDCSKYQWIMSEQQKEDTTS